MRYRGHRVARRWGYKPWLLGFVVLLLVQCRGSVPREEPRPRAMPPILAPCHEGELTGTAVVVRCREAIDELHEWAHGGYGELIEPLALQLSTVEAYFLAFEEGRLTVCCTHPLPAEDASSDASSASVGICTTFLSEAECWAAFCSSGEAFPQRYVVYRALRTAGWNVRTGVKYGANFTLYAPSGTPTSHALLSALVASAVDPAERSWCWLQQHVRLCHGVAKGATLTSGRPAARTERGDVAPISSHDGALKSCVDRGPPMLGRASRENAC